MCFACTLVATTQERVDVSARAELLRNGRPLKNSSGIVIWLTPIGNTLVENAPPQTKSQIPKLVQQDKAFHPSLVIVPVGGQVEFPNHDPFFHNVFSLFEGKRFDLGLYESGSTQFVRFDKPGISYIFCNIHAQMSAVVIALNTPYHGISNAGGEVHIPDVVPGRYEMHLFDASVPTEVLHAQEHEVVISDASKNLGVIVLSESELQMAHKNKYGRDYDPPDPDNPAYIRP